MSREWGMIETAYVHSKRKIRVPPMLKDRVVFTHDYRGECVRWYLDTEAHVAVLSAVELEDERYSHFKNTTLHDQSNTVTPPKELLTAICGELDCFYEAEDLFPEQGTSVYIATYNMINEEPYASYLLSSKRLFEMMDADSTHDGSLSQIMRSATD